MLRVVFGNRVLRVVSAVAGAIAYVALGLAVSRTPPALDIAAHDVFYGHGVAAAAAFTQAGRFPVYVALCAALLVFGAVRRTWLRRAVVGVVVLAAAWRVGDAFKDYFERARPERGLVFKEPSYAYASSHATLALTFYAGLALYVWRANLPLGARTAAGFAAAAFIVAQTWSRLALGAHWLTDILGGFLLAVPFLVIQDALNRSRASSAGASRASTATAR
jgi:undecaprenyl-diphosphatase